MKNHSKKIISWLFPTFSNLLFITAFIGVLIRGQRMINQDGDLGRHLTIGRYILEQGKIPLRDIFSHTMIGQPLTPHEWLAQVIFALAEKAMGFAGIILLCALLIAATVVIVFGLARSGSRTLITALLAALLSMITSTVHWLARPHLFTFLLLALWWTALVKMRQGKLKHWWVLPLIMLLWANLHGAFIAGFVTWLIYGVGIALDVFFHDTPRDTSLPFHFWRHYLLGGLISFGVTLLNPSGIGLWRTSVGYIGNTYLIDRTLEYQSPNFHQAGFWPFLIYVGLLLVSIGLNKKRTESGMLFNSAAWLVMGLYSARNVPLFAIIAAPSFGQGLDQLIINTSSKMKFVQRIVDMDNRIKAIDHQLKGYFWPAVSILIVIIGLASGLRFDHQGLGYEFDPEVFPVDAVNWLEENPQEGEMFNYFTWGGYLLYRGWPEMRVFIDGQTDFYGEELTRQYAQVIGAEEGWKDVLDQYHVTWAILPPDEDAAEAMRSDPNWEVMYKDEVALIIKR